ncbi:MAG: Type IV-A pilus assembly ATPase PilB [Parcubacteria group bacterium GW2011_GWA2_45_14]|nr:MAG: Type IV-A pilus assembly ATPase PilB [Parcubacteria group bacterium GW2011_GWA2_45_14]
MYNQSMDGDQSRAYGTVEARLDALNVQQEERLARRRAQLLQLPYVDLFAFPFEPSILEMVPKTEAQVVGAVLFYKRGNDIKIGAVNPQIEGFVELLDRLKVRFGLLPQVYVISHHSLKIALGRYRKDAEFVPIDADLLVVPEAQLKEFEHAIDSFSALGDKISSIPASQLLGPVMAGAVQMRASDIHVEPKRDQARLRYRVDGVLQDVATFGLDGWRQLLPRIKVLSNLKINVHMVPQEGSFVMHIGKTKYDIRVSILPGGTGEYIVLRLLSRKEGVMELKDLGMKASDRDLVLDTLKESTGMILSAGPTGSGKTTTIAACLREVNRPELKIITLEDPIEYRVPGLEQTEIDVDSGYTFAVGLRSILRQDPDVIFVGEMRDEETVETSIYAAMTGHLVFSTIHSNDALGVILRLIGMGVQPYVLAPAVNLIIAQRLVRVVCRECAEVYKPDRAIREHINDVMERVNKTLFNPAKLMDPALQFYRAKRCKECGQTGYRGRVGVFELLPVKGEVEEMILRQEDMMALQEAAIRKGMTTIAQDAYLKVIEGITTVEEVERISEE